jgi:5'-deoxynucleotidase YfbR-like HD superfamily hydrolase
LSQPTLIKAKLMEALALKGLDRAGWVRAGVRKPESVAAHSWGVAWLALSLCPPEVNRERALELAIVHDLPEVHSGDITPHDGISKKEKARRERAALSRLVEGHPKADELTALWEEYEAGESPEARFIKACDKLDMALQAQWIESQQKDLDLGEFVQSALAKLGDSVWTELLH